MRSLFVPLTFLFFTGVAKASTHTVEVIPKSEYQATGHDKAEFQTQLNFVKFPNMRWTREQIVSYLKVVAQVFNQCSVRFDEVKIYTVTSPVFRPEVELYKQDSEFAFAAISDQTADVPRPAVYLVDQMIDSGEPARQEPFSKAWFSEFVDNVTRTHLSLVDTVWMPYFTNSEEYFRGRNYNGMAHELLHVYSLDGMHNDNETSNLMTLFILKRRSNYILPEHCELMRQNAHVKKIN